MTLKIGDTVYLTVHVAKSDDSPSRQMGDSCTVKGYSAPKHYWIQFEDSDKLYLYLGDYLSKAYVESFDELY